jgi:hypothetical protein
MHLELTVLAETKLANGLCLFVLVGASLICRITFSVRLPWLDFFAARHLIAVQALITYRSPCACVIFSDKEFSFLARSAGCAQ